MSRHAGIPSASGGMRQGVQAVTVSPVQAERVHLAPVMSLPSSEAPCPLPRVTQQTAVSHSFTFPFFFSLLLHFARKVS